MNARRIGFVLGCLSVGAFAAAGGCSSSSSSPGTGGGGDGGSSSGGSSGGSSSGGSSGSSSSGGSSGGSGGSSGGSSSGGSSGGSSGSSSGGVSTPYYGTITAIESMQGGKSNFLTAAAFHATPDGGLGPTCAGTTSGSCCYTAAGAAPKPPPNVSAGTITITDGGKTIGSMAPMTVGTTMDVYGDNSATTATLKWAAGSTLSFGAAGAMANAFTGTVVAGGFMQGIMPALSQTAALTVPKASDFTISWTPGTMAGSLAYFVIGALKGSASDGTIDCQLMDSAGTVTVSKTLLANMTTGDNLELALDRLETNRVTQGNVTVTVAAFAATTGIGKLQ